MVSISVILFQLHLRLILIVTTVGSEAGDCFTGHGSLHGHRSLEYL